MWSSRNGNVNVIPRRQFGSLQTNLIKFKLQLRYIHAQAGHACFFTLGELGVFAIRSIYNVDVFRKVEKLLT